MSPSHVAFFQLVYVMSQLYNYLMEMYTNFLQNLTFREHVTSLSFIPTGRYVRAVMNVHAFMNELD